MNNQKEYIVQFVGFKTSLDKEEFIKRWKPFAENFKRAGISSIDLYKVGNSNDITYISRNIWQYDLYFKNFPSGTAGEGRGNGITVVQFGGYQIDETQLARSNEMRIVFTNDSLLTGFVARKRCSDNVKFLYQLETDVSHNDLFRENKYYFSCSHLTTM